MKYRLYYTISIITPLVFCLKAIDNPHFYRATNFFLEPRIEHPFLTSFDATIGGGSSSTAKNANHKTVPLLDIYGTHHIQTIGLDVPNITSNKYSSLLQALSLLPERKNFATISINGTFSIIETNLSYTQNLLKGFLLFFHIPVRKLSIDDIKFIDLSPEDAIFPNKNTPEWKKVWHRLPFILKSTDININPQTEIGVGDFSSYFGWTHNYQETKILDFIDTTIMAGILAPTGKKRKENALFALPLGYNGHWGFPISGMACLGMYGWITMGAYFNTIFFADKITTLPIKTNEKQKGIIKLAKTDVSMHKGPIWHTGIYLKADHFAYGLSFTTAYSFAGEAKSKIKAFNCKEFNTTLINSDSSLQNWNMHTLHFLAEYDFAKEDSSTGNRIGIFYNYQVGGKRIFKTNVGGGSLGLDISWSM